MSSRTTYSYSGPCATVKDEATNAANPSNPGSNKTICQDAAGRIASVTETIPGASPSSQVTTYTYDGLNNLTDVYQGSQHRMFRYDAMGRLTSATNPENGSTSYSYDYNGNLIAKTDAAGVTTCNGPVSGSSCN